MNKKFIIYSILSMLLTVLAFVIYIPWIYVFVAIFFLVYYIKKIYKKQNTKINYIGLIFFLIMTVVGISAIGFSFIAGGLFVFLLFLWIGLNGIATIFERIVLLKNNKKKIALVFIVAVLIFFVASKLIIIKIPYQVCETSIGLFNNSTIKVIKNIEDLDTLSEDKEIWSFGLTEAKKNTTSKYIKEKLKESFEIDNDFFDKYYIILVQDITGNSASPLGCDYITYNRITQNVNLIQEDILFGGGGSDVMSYECSFYKIDKKYMGKIGWKTKYLLYDSIVYVLSDIIDSIIYYF